MQRWENPEKARYYQADLVVDLLGDWVVVTAWGGLDSRLGQVRRTWVTSEEEGRRRLLEIEKRRRQRHYRAVSDSCDAGG